MKNQTVYNRSAHNAMNFYTMVSNALIKDTRIGGLEIGIMTYMLSQSDTWVVNKSQIMDRMGFGKTVFNKAWKNLVELGYIQKKNIQGGVKWIINEDPCNSTVSESIPATSEPVLSVEDELLALDAELAQEEPKSTLKAITTSEARKLGNYINESIEQDYPLNDRDIKLLDYSIDFYGGLDEAKDQVDKRIAIAGLGKGISYYIKPQETK